MSDPIQKTKEDVANAMRVVKKLTQIWHLDEAPILLPDVQGGYFLLHRSGNLLAVCKAMRRNILSTAFGTFKFSNRKWLKACDFASSRLVPFVLVVQWDDKLGRLKSGESKPDYLLDKDGRPPRPGMTTDLELMAYFYIKQFKILEDGPA